MVKAKKSEGAPVISVVPRASKLDQHAVAYAVAIVAAVKVLLLSVFARMGWLMAGDILDKLLFTWKSSYLGILSGMAEAGVAGLVLGFVGAWLYNRFA